MEQISWNSLPSVVLLEVFSYLTHKDKINASSTCKYWRGTLYHASFWQSIHFIMKTNDANSISRTRFLSSCFAKKLRNATVTIDSLDPLCVQESARVLQQLCENTHLQRLILKPSHCKFSFRGKKYLDRYLLEPLQLLAQQCRNLEALNLGFSEELTTYAKPILDLLQEHQSCSLSHLGLASVKENPDDYLLLDLDAMFFRSFQRLQVLSLDYDYISDSLLSSLGRMKRFIVNVHGIEDSHPGTTNLAWSNFAHLNPSCELRLNLIHSYDSVEALHSDILKPAMPLTHLKAFFCNGVNINALYLLSRWYSKSLCSLWLVESLDINGSPYLIQIDNDNEPTDPLVMAAWMCIKLEEIVILGYKYFAYDVIGIARLRGPLLKRFDVLEEDIADIHCMEDLLQEVSRCLDRTWTPLQSSQLHNAITHPLGNNSDEFILPITLQDHDV